MIVASKAAAGRRLRRPARAEARALASQEPNPTRIDQPLPFARCDRSRCLVLFRERSDYGRQVGLARVGCRSWRCSACRQKKARDWLSRMRRWGFQPTVFMLLTVDPQSIHAEMGSDAFGAQLAYLSACWTEFVRRLRRLDDRPVSFVVVREFTRRGNVHLHAMLESSFQTGGRSKSDPRGPAYDRRKDYLARVARDSGFGLCWARDVWDQEGAARYLTKYLSKEPGDVEMRSWYRYESPVFGPAAAGDEQGLRPKPRLRLVSCSRDLKPVRFDYYSTDIWCGGGGVASEDHETLAFKALGMAGLLAMDGCSLLVWSDGMGDFVFSSSGSGRVRVRRRGSGEGVPEGVFRGD